LSKTNFGPTITDELSLAILASAGEEDALECVMLRPTFRYLLAANMVAMGLIYQGTSASASTDDVGFKFLGHTIPSTGVQVIHVSGTIVTTCDNCFLNSLDVLSWSFSWDGPFSGLAAGTGADVVISGHPTLSASGGLIQFVAFADSSESFESSSLPSGVHFGLDMNLVLECNVDNCIQLRQLSGATITDTIGLPVTPPPFTIATERTVSQIPLPAALPLFASGLVGLGLLGRRRKKDSVGH
jgi:hypothetical protein